MSNAGYGNHDASRPGEGVPVVPASSPAQPGSPTGTPKPADDRGHEATPGDGAGADGPQGDEVDPGTG